MCPVCFYALYFALTRVPRMFVANTNLYTGTTIEDVTLLRYCFITMVHLCVVCISMLCLDNSGCAKKEQERIFLNPHRVFRGGLICFAVGAVARKLCHTIHAVLKNNTPYEIKQ